MALYALLPMLLAVAAGRFSDRVGVRRPMRLGTAAIAVGAALPVALPGLPVAVRKRRRARDRLHGVPGRDAERDRRARRPVGARAEFQPAGARLFDLGLHRAAGRGFRDRPSGVRSDVRVARRGALHPAVCAREPPPRAPGAASARRAARTTVACARCCATARCAACFAINALFAVGWDLHTVFVPIYGARIGLSAPPQIGLVLSTFAAATFVVRLLMPAIARRTSRAPGADGRAVRRRRASTCCSRSRRVRRRCSRCRSASASGSAAGSRW